MPLRRADPGAAQMPRASCESAQDIRGTPEGNTWAAGTVDARHRGMSEHADWRTLYRIAAVAATAVLALVPIQMFVFLRWPPPDAVADWFALYQQNAVVGLIDMDLLLIVDQILIAVVCLALCVCLWRTSRAWMSVALLFAVIACATYIASNPAFEMLRLSHRFEAAITPIQRMQALSAGEAMVATWLGSSFATGYVLGALAFLIIAFVMLRSDVFSRMAGYVGLGFAALSLVPASAGRLGLVMSLLSLAPMWLWLALVAHRMWELGRTPAEPASSAPITMEEARAHG